MPKLTIDGREFEAREDMTVLECCREMDIDIPTMCHHESLKPYASCRLCLVEVFDGRRSKMVTSCAFPAKNGIEVTTNSDKVLKARRGVMEMTLARSSKSPRVIALAKKMGVDVADERLTRRDNDCIMCGLCVRICSDVMGRSAIGFIGRGNERHIGVAFDRDSVECMECGACASVCPTFSQTVRMEAIKSKAAEKIGKEFDQNLASRSPVYIPYAQAVPGIPTIDRDRCAHFLTGECKVCEKFCKADAIDFDQQDEEVEVEVGAVVMSPGFKPYDPTGRSVGYKYQNVVTSLEFERILSASGPYAGHIARPSDRKKPIRLAFVQCVGSREPQIGKDYCSGVCCTYAIKEAVIAKEHGGDDIKPTIFYMDLRTHGKDFEKYYVRARDRYGVNFVRSGVSEIMENPDSGDLLIKHVDEAGHAHIDEYDMVVLSIGLDKPRNVEDVAEMMGVELNRFGFGEGPTFQPSQTSREGIFSAGAFSGPMDIPETVVRASAAAANAGAVLQAARGELSQTKVYPPERDTAGEPARVGVFVCHCGVNIAGVVDVADVADYARTLPGVVYSENTLYACSGDTQGHMKEMIEKHNINRVVVASCSPRTHEPLFQETTREAGLNRYLFDMANIRDHCSWVHADQPVLATSKSKDLVRMSVAKVRLLNPLQTTQLPVTKRSIVVGGGLAGMTAALSTADNGYEAVLVEKTNELGGNLRNLHHTLTGDDPHALLQETINKVLANSRIRVILESEVKETTGFVGNFQSVIAPVNGIGEAETLEHGTVILATGASEWRGTEEYLYGRNENVVTQLQFEDELETFESPDEAPDSVVMIQCVGSREEGHQYCSRVCCAGAINNALKLKEINPKARIYVLYRDIRTYGFLETFYQEAREKGIIFVRYDEDAKPDVKIDGGRVTVRIKDRVIDRTLKIQPERLVLSTRVEANPGNHETAMNFKVPVNEDGFFLEAHVKLRPVDMATEGIFVAGLAHAPKSSTESISQAQAAAGRSVVILSRDHVESVAQVSTVDNDLCAACGQCLTLCAYGAIDLQEVPGPVRGTARTVAVINEALCKGCGACAASCRCGAIDVSGFTDKQLVTMLENLAID